MVSTPKKVVVFKPAARADVIASPSHVVRTAPEILGLTGTHDPSGSFRPHAHNQRRIGDPRIGEVYWCQFTDTILPEVGKNRPVIVVSVNNKGGRCVTVVPLTTQPGVTLDFGMVPLSSNPNPNDEGDVWAIAGQLHSVSHWRLSRYADFSLGRKVTPRVSDDDLQAILRMLAENLGKPRLTR